MPTATTIVRRAAVRADRVADTVTLDRAARDAVTGPLVAEGGLGFDVALTKAAALEDGDALRLDDGRLVAVRAAADDLLEVRAENPARLLGLAWQLAGSHAHLGQFALLGPQRGGEALQLHGLQATVGASAEPEHRRQPEHCEPATA